MVGGGRGGGGGGGGGGGAGGGFVMRFEPCAGVGRAIFSYP